MKSTVTIYKDGEIQQQYDVVGFQKAVGTALEHLCTFMREHVRSDEKDLVVECRYMAHAEWTCTATHIDDEVFGLDVRRAI